MKFHDQVDGVDDCLMENEKRTNWMLWQFEIQQMIDARVVHRKTCVKYASIIVTCVMDNFMFYLSGINNGAPKGALKYGKGSSIIYSTHGEASKSKTRNFSFLKIYFLKNLGYIFHIEIQHQFNTYKRNVWSQNTWMVG